ncbi:MAG: 50S ribosomal protein L10 [Alphaproteobacteria bacterium]
MDRSQKEQIVATLHQIFADAALVVVTRPQGLTVAEATELRRQMGQAGATYRVIKNRLTRIAIEGTPYAALSDLFSGPTAIAYSEDPVAAAKVAVDYAKGNEKLVILGGALRENVLDGAGVKALATLPSLDELRGKLVGLLQAPATKVARVLQAPAGQLARVFNAYATGDEAA